MSEDRDPSERWRALDTAAQLRVIRGYHEDLIKRKRWVAKFTPRNNGGKRMLAEAKEAIAVDKAMLVMLRAVTDYAVFAVVDGEQEQSKP